MCAVVALSKPSNALQKNALLEARRRDEDRRAVYQATIADTIKVQGVVEFQHRSDARIVSNAVRDAIKAANVKVKLQVDRRRAALAGLLESERAQYEREIEATFESPDAAKARLVHSPRGLARPLFSLSPPRPTPKQHARSRP